ncbi:MAG TPA: flagellar cap protein FliD N-terminal domain-containing protein, partial [Gammaproteobacteria bacterium]|nr:flagellar cap protein FliD N-terminal domain-containing protein [Gammaproteobacteria bacterium]
MALSSPGIGSGLDVNGIVTKLMAIEAQPMALLDRREASYQAKLSAYGSLQGALSSFQTTARGLNDAAKFNSLKASSSDSTVA